MTPRQLFALKKRKIQEMQWMELMFSRLTAAVCNFGFARPKQPAEQTAFMIHPFKEPQAAPDELPGDTIIRMLEQMPAGTAYRV